RWPVKSTSLCRRSPTQRLTVHLPPRARPRRSSPACRLRQDPFPIHPQVAGLRVIVSPGRVQRTYQVRSRIVPRSASSCHLTGDRHLHSPSQRSIPQVTPQAVGQNVDTFIGNARVNGDLSDTLAELLAELKRRSQDAEEDIPTP